MGRTVTTGAQQHLAMAGRLLQQGMLMVPTPANPRSGAGSMAVESGEQEKQQPGLLEMYTGICFGTCRAFAYRRSH